MKTLVLLLPLILAGCTGVPANRISVNFKSGAVEITAPKNTIVEGLTFARDTNATITVQIQRWQSTNDPAVISKAAAGQAQIIREWNGVLKTALKAAGVVVP